MNNVIKIKLAVKVFCSYLSTQASDVVGRQQTVSKAMKAYLERAKQHDDFIKTQLTEYEIGKRHLANMMGEDPETFTQADIDTALEYLMPSGLFEPRARPVMKHPDLMFPKRKEAEFDVSGRPYHYLFYTGSPNYFGILHEISGHLEHLNRYEDNMIAKGIVEADGSQKVNLSSTSWLSVDALRKLLLEDIREYEVGLDIQNGTGQHVKHGLHNLTESHYTFFEKYDYFVKCMATLAAHPYSSQIKDFIMKFRAQLAVEDTVTEIPKIKYDNNGRPFMDAVGQRKWAVAKVIVSGEGTGKIRINNTDITYFTSLQDREQVLFPLLHTGLIDKVDVQAEVAESGHASQAGAIRYGISLALRSFVSPEQLEAMRLAGLLTRDPRVRERKKPGQEGARRKYTWRKR